MKLHSVKFKYLLIVIAAILAIAVFVGGVSIYEVDKYIQQHTKKYIEITCANEAAKINDMFCDIEKSVKIMESYVLSLIEKTTDIENRDYQTKTLQIAGEMFRNIATNTNCAIAYYLRFDPTISDGKSGIFYTKMDGEEYVSLEPTDLSFYNKDDTEHVGWYWKPYKAGKPIWLEPYFNQNNSILMISYVIPLYVEKRFIGIVGMDFDYTVLTNQVNQIQIYETGHAHLALDNIAIHTGNKSPVEDNHTDSDEYLKISEDLVNGMTLTLFASYKDIQAIRYKIIYKIVVSVILLTLIFSFIVILMVRKAIRPLKKLTEASVEISNGNFDIKIPHGNTYEVEQLSLAFEIMQMNLREHEKLQHMLAYRDSLTGLRNMASYKKWAADFDKKIQNGKVSFGIVVFDLNYLKETNDTYGHDLGNKLIETAAALISNTFKRSPVFRIGGDEFVAILQDRDLDMLEVLFKKLDAESANTFIEANNTNLPVSIAKGFSLFNPNTDTQIADVFNRADEDMYKTKKI